MRRTRLLFLLLATATTLLGCSESSRSKNARTIAPLGSSSTQPTTSASSQPVTSGGTTSVSSATTVTSTTSPLTAPTGVASLGRGLRWTRTEPPFVSGLITTLGPMNRAEVDRYLDDFKASAVHVWQDGLPAEIDSFRATGRPDVRWLAWLLPDGTSQGNGQFMGGYPANAPGRIGFQISDEPRSLTELLALEVGLNRVRAADPDALLVVNFTYHAPDITAQLDYFVTSMDADVVAYDDYRQSWRAYENLARFRQVGLLARKPYWRYLYGFEGGHGRPHASDMRWDAFAGLVYGYTGFTWFLYNVDPVHGLAPLFFPTPGQLGTPTPELAIAGQLNQELRTLGRAITQLTSTDVRYQPQFAFIQPPHTSPWTQGAGNDPYLVGVRSTASDLLLGVFADDRGDTYLMVQNVNHRGGSFPTGTTNATSLTLEFDFATAPTTVDHDAVQTLDRVTGQVSDLPLRPSGNTQRTLTVRLEAGEPVLLKYRTGKPFALR